MSNAQDSLLSMLINRGLINSDTKNLRRRSKESEEHGMDRSQFQTNGEVSVGLFCSQEITPNTIALFV